MILTLNHHNKITNFHLPPTPKVIGFGYNRQKQASGAMTEDDFVQEPTEVDDDLYINDGCTYHLKASAVACAGSQSYAIMKISKP
jgi:hypothetical protein